jgi:hypothetical protein
MPIDQVPDAIFPTNNEWDIPTLFPKLQADFIDAPVRGWGSIKRKTTMRGTWHFYTDDYKFAAMWSKPDEMLKTQAISVVEVNYTTDDQMPMAMCLYRIFQKRWLSRYWQAKGIRIFADLNVAEKCDTINLLGIPDGWRSYATSVSDNSIEILMRHVEIAQLKAGTDDINLLVYGGGPEIKKLCAKNHWVNIPDARNAARSNKNA